MVYFYWGFQYSYAYIIVPSLVHQSLGAGPRIEPGIYYALRQAGYNNHLAMPHPTFSPIPYKLPSKERVRVRHCESNKKGTFQLKTKFFEEKTEIIAFYSMLVGTSWNQAVRIIPTVVCTFDPIILKESIFFWSHFFRSSVPLNLSSSNGARTLIIRAFSPLSIAHCSHVRCGTQARWMHKNGKM